MNARDLLFHSADQKVNVSVYFKNGSFWLTQKTMAELFGVIFPAVSKHLKNTFESEELKTNSVISILETTAEDGKNYNTKFYQLEATLNIVRKCNFRNRKTSKYI